LVTLLGASISEFPITPGVPGQVKKSIMISYLDPVETMVIATVCIRKTALLLAVAVIRITMPGEMMEDMEDAGGERSMGRI
jgi:hypothetical protein